MGELVWLNGRLISSSEARISPFDRGFLYGDGLFETMRSYQGVLHLLRRHLTRLYDGAAVLGLQLPPKADLRDGLYEVLRANSCHHARIRLTVSRGSEVSGQPTIFIYQQPLLHNDNIPPSEEITVFKRLRELPEIMPRLKSLNYLPELLAREEAHGQGLREGIFLSPEGFVTEGAVSNIFMVKNNRLITSPVSLGILPGILRGRVLELAGSEGVKVEERAFTLADLLNADECFYTNSVREIVPVHSLDGNRIGESTIGPVTQHLWNAYRAELPDESL